MTFSHGKPTRHGTGFSHGSIGGPGTFPHPSTKRQGTPVRVPRPGPGFGDGVRRSLKWMLWLIPIFFLLFGPLFDEKYPNLDFGVLPCDGNVQPISLTYIFDDSGSLFWNDPNQRRYEEAREVTEWWSNESCDVEDQVSVVHFDDVIPAVLPTPVRGIDLTDQFRFGPQSSSSIAQPLAKAVEWGRTSPGPSVAVVFSDGQTPDTSQGIAILRTYPELDVIFVSLGGPLPADWQVDEIDQVFVLDNRPTLGAVGTAIAQVLRDQLEESS